MIDIAAVPRPFAGRYNTRQPSAIKEKTVKLVSNIGTSFRRPRARAWLAGAAMVTLSVATMGSTVSAGKIEEDIQIDHGCTDYSPFPDGYVVIDFPEAEVGSADGALYSAYVKPAADEWPDAAPTVLGDYESRKYEAVRSEPADSELFEQIEIYTLDENGLNLPAIVDPDLRDIVTGTFDVRVVRDDFFLTSDEENEREIVAEETVTIVCVPGFVPPRIIVPTTTVPKTLPKTGGDNTSLLLTAPLLVLLGGGLILVRRRMTTD